MSFSLTFLCSVLVCRLPMLIYWLTVGSSIESAVDFGEFFTAFTNSLTISTLGATLTVICALPLVWAAVRYRSKLTIWLDRIPYLLHAVPGLVIALSLVFFTINMRIRFIKPLPWLSSPTLCFIFLWHKRPCVARLNKCLVTLKGRAKLRP